jgi:NADH:ubiquinone oxidoreductase subunit D
MGPQHPSMHGVLRLIVTLDGEDVVDCEPILGSLQRGMENHIKPEFRFEINL